MAWPRCRRSEPRSSANTPTRFSGNSGSLRPRSKICAPAVRFPHRGQCQPWPEGRTRRERDDLRALTGPCRAIVPRPCGALVGRQVADLHRVGSSRCRYRRGAQQTRLRVRRPLGCPDAERGRLPSADLRLRPARSDRGAVECAALGGGDRPHSRRCSPHGLIRHSSLPLPTVTLAWQLVLDQEPLDLGDDGSRSTPINDPDAVLALIYTSGTTGHPKGVVVTHANMLADVEHFDYWMPHKNGP